MVKVLGLALSFLLCSSSAFAEDGKLKAENMVQKAIQTVKKDGKEAVIDLVNKADPQFKEGEAYIVVYDLDGKCLAHATKPTRVGQNMINDQDSNGVYFIKERIELMKSKGKGWLSYKFQNPVNKKLELKDAYCELYEKLVYCAGAYTKK